MKYLVIGALLALVFVVVYSRLRPYLELLRKVSNALKGTLDQSSPYSSRGSIQSKNKLVKCVACGTWIPLERSMSVSSLSEYCSRECLEKAAVSRERKRAG